MILGAFISLAGLSIWHGRLIAKGETSIESHINKKETKRLNEINQVSLYRSFFGGLKVRVGLLQRLLKHNI